MSELKVYKDIDDYVGYDETPEEMYDKYEADLVIAELKADYKEACDRLQTDNLIKDEQIAATRYNKYKRCLARKNNHSNYKRCLAMAKYWVAVSYHCVDDKHRQSAERHHRKWLDLARKLKEAK